MVSAPAGRWCQKPRPTDRPGLIAAVTDSDLRRQALRTSQRTVYYADDDQAVFLAVDTHPVTADDFLLARFLIATTTTADGQTIPHTW